MANLFQTLRDEWPVLNGARWSVAAIVLVSLGTGFAAAWFIEPLVAPKAPASQIRAVTKGGGSTIVGASTAQVQSAAPAAGRGRAQNAQVGAVSSVNQKGGVTAAVVGDVKQ
jgi:hypothetical protein